jgi:probable rRNA maturation factor
LLNSALFMNIYITNKQQDLSIDKSLIQNIIKKLSLFHKTSFDEVSFHFVSPNKIKSLHQQLFNNPTVTDCITCPIDPPNQKPYCLLGEVFVCPQVAISYAKEHNLDAFEELILYVVHGFLHLIGYDDMNVKDEKLMRKMERESIEHLKQEKVC